MIFFTFPINDKINSFFLFLFRFWTKRWMNWFYNDVCFVCGSVYNITCRNKLNNASVLNFRGGFRYQCEYPWCIIEVKVRIFQQLWKKSIFLYCSNSKTKLITVNVWNFHQMFILVLSIHSWIFIIFFKLFIDDHYSDLL